MKKLSQNQTISLFGILIIGAIMSTPVIFAAVEPHIILTMDLGQTTDPFTIENNTGTDVFTVSSKGEANNVLGISLSTDDSVKTVLATNDITDPVVLVSYTINGKSGFPAGEYYIPMGWGVMSGIGQRDTGVGNCVGGWFKNNGGTWSDSRGSIGTTAASYTHLTHEWGTSWLPEDAEQWGYILYNSNSATTCSFTQITAMMEIVLPQGVTFEMN
jgi:hypothetical protein